MLNAVFSSYCKLPPSQMMSSRIRSNRQIIWLKLDLVSFLISVPHGRVIACFFYPQSRRHEAWSPSNQISDGRQKYTLKKLPEAYLVLPFCFLCRKTTLTAQRWGYSWSAIYRRIYSTVLRYWARTQKWFSWTNNLGPTSILRQILK